MSKASSYISKNDAVFLTTKSVSSERENSCRISALGISLSYLQFQIEAAGTEYANEQLKKRE